METIDLKLDDSNDLLFKVVVEGVRDPNVKVRLVLEDDSGFSYMFPGKAESNDQVGVIIPPMKRIIKEGKYEASLEVIAEERHFVPVKFGVNFENGVNVTGEIIRKDKAEKKSLVEVKAEVVSQEPKADDKIIEAAVPVKKKNTKTQKNTDKKKKIQENTKPSPPAPKAKKKQSKVVSAEKLRIMIREMLDS